MELLFLASGILLISHDASKQFSRTSVPSMVDEWHGVCLDVPSSPPKKPHLVIGGTLCRGLGLEYVMLKVIPGVMLGLKVPHPGCECYPP